MKKNYYTIKKYLLVFMVLSIMSFMNTSKTEAAMDINLSPAYVSDIDNVLFPSTSQYYVYDGLQGSGWFKVDKPTIVKAYFNWDATTAKSITGTAWFSRDAMGLDIVGSSKRLANVGDSILVFLDPGIYYVNHLFHVKDASLSTSLRIGVALLAEETNSNETVYSSSYANANQLSLDKPFRGFLSTVSPIDYYKFTIENDSRVIISYNFEQTDDVNVSGGVCTLYDISNQKIKAGNFNSSGIESNQFSEFLAKGTYYIAMSGTTCATNLKVSAVSYVISTSLSNEDWTNQNITLKVTTEFEPVEVLIINKKISFARINDGSIWSYYADGCHEIENNKYTIKKNGYYTIRVRDLENNLILKQVHVTNIDKSSPVITGVTNGRSYRSGTVIKFYDKNSDIKKAKLNGTSIYSGKKIVKKGKYALSVYDYAGNVKKIVFYIR